MEKTTILILSRGRLDAALIEAIHLLKKEHNIIVIADKSNINRYQQIKDITIIPALERQDIYKKLTEEQLIDIKTIEKKLGLNCYEFNINYLLYRKFVSRYGVTNIHKETNEHIPQQVYFYYNFFLKIIQEHNVDYAFCETLDLIDSMIISRMAEKGFIKKMFERGVMSVGGELRLYIATGQHRRSSRIEWILNNSHLSEESMIWAIATVSKYKKDRLTSKYDDYYVKISGLLPRYSFHQILNKIKRIINGETLLPAIIKLKNRILSAKYFSKKIPDGKIICYFLQLTPEATMCSQAPEYANQEHMLEQIAIHGKCGYTLAIKEHPVCYGNRAPSFYKELALLPNVVLLPPSYPTRDLILKSEAVITATGTTAGLEAVATGKPVLCLGAPYYNLCGNNIRLEKPQDVWSAIENIQFTEDAQLKFLASLHQATYEHPQFGSTEEYQKAKGIGDVIARALDDEIKLYESGVLK
ncbi:hypothetical protein [Maridesulfovibrio ferrireducens]|uniref:capsular polysaccharide export protein, LipB/KpsS family n=1 Tax=Maridesulfovibrio ferrireducens TaxID=246191 RepID=UPI001A1FED24|nr:hypothetical protein [Maridesulfovibrio ferrireducens]MBI9112693.1 hypothetical protein [Maridesulfovibrio ferrireducens]